MDEILNLIESFSEEFPSYSYIWEQLMELVEDLLFMVIHVIYKYKSK